MDQVAPTPPGYGGRWDLTDGTPDRIVWDLHCIGGATLRRACIASGVPTSGTKVQMARRLYALGLDAARVRSAHTQTGRRD
jgi:hypothetical protein